MGDFGYPNSSNEVFAGLLAGSSDACGKIIVPFLVSLSNSRRFVIFGIKEIVLEFWRIEEVWWVGLVLALVDGLGLSELLMDFVDFFLLF